MITEVNGEPDVFEDANQELIGAFADLFDGYFDRADDEIKEELIIKVHQLDARRRLKLYTKWRKQQIQNTSDKEPTRE